MLRVACVGRPNIIYSSIDLHLHVKFGMVFTAGCPSCRQPLLVASYDTQRIRWVRSSPGPIRDYWRKQYNIFKLFTTVKIEGVKNFSNPVRWLNG